MSDLGKKKKPSGDGDAGAAGAASYDPATLLSLYSMQYAAGGLGGLGGLAAAAAAAQQAAVQQQIATPSPSTSSPSNPGPYGGLGTLGVAASQAANLGVNQASAAWWTMASQLAAQDYLARFQQQAASASGGGGAGGAPAATRAGSGAVPGPPGSGDSSSSAMASMASAYAAALASNQQQQRKVSESPSMLESLRLPSDTELIKYTSSSTGPKVPGTTNRGRKKTISLDPSTTNSNSTEGSSSNLGVLLGSSASSGGFSPPPTIPAAVSTSGQVQSLTIERKKPGRKPMDPDNHTGGTVDKVEITKVPIGTSSSVIPTAKSSSTTTAFPLFPTPSDASGSDGLNMMRPTSAATITPSSSVQKTTSGKIPSEYYASQALSGVFLAEQIRQQQLAAALESRLSETTSSSAPPKDKSAGNSSSADLMQAAMLVSRLREAAAAAAMAASSKDPAGEETSSKQLLAIAAAAAAAAAANNGGEATSAGGKSVGKSRSGQRKVPPKKNTVASMLMANKQQQQKPMATLTPEELEMAERATGNPELTIEPLFKSLRPDSSFDLSSSDRSRRASEGSQLKIKTVGESTPEIKNLTTPPKRGVSDDVEDYEDFSSSAEHGTKSHKKSGKQREDDKAAASTNASACHRAPVGRYATVETAELRLPLKTGWRRETLVREYSKSGVRGDVVYYAPCGKKFKQYPDIVRYLEKNGLTHLSREHFSFSTKIFIGEFLKPTGVSGEDGEEKYLRLDEKEMLDDVDKIRKENGWKPRKRPSTCTQPQTSSGPPPAKKAHESSSESNDHPPQFESQMTPEQKILARLQAEMHVREQQEELRLQKEAMRFIRETERLEKQEQARRKREAKQQQMLEEKKRRQEEIQRQRQEENLRRLQEKELKRQQAALIKEQERERRRQHLILMKQLEGKKRWDEREKRREELKVEKERERERKLEQKRLENLIIAEMRKPVEDLTLREEEDGQREIPEIQRIPELLLSGEAFANILMVYEFLHNFGERLGFDMESLPSLSDFQAALLNDPEAEEELLSVVIHLLVCAIDDPGIPTPHKHLTLLGQNLRQADITNTNVSEILKIYLTARGQAEVKNLHGVTPPETHSSKDRSREIPFCHKRMEEFQRLLRQTRAWEMAQWVKDRPFLSLNPTEKGEILAFVCNELLFNKAVLHKIETNVEKVSRARKVRLVIENRLRKLKSIQLRKFRCGPHVSSPYIGGNSITSSPTKPVNVSESTNVSTVNEESNLSEAPGTNNASHTETSSVAAADDNVSTVSEATTIPPAKPPPKKRGRKPKYKGKKKGPKAKVGRKKKKIKGIAALAAKKAASEPAEDAAAAATTAASSEANDDSGDDLNNLSDVDLADLEDDGEDDEKLTQDELIKKIEKTSKQLTKARDDVVFLNNCLRVNDLGQDRFRRRYWHFAHAGGVFVEGLESAEPWKLETKGMPHLDKTTVSKVEEESEHNDDSDEEIDDVEPAEKKPKIENESSDEMSPAAEEALRRLGHEILVTPKTEVKALLPLPKVTPNADKLNLFNHSAQFNMALSPVVLNGSVTITPKTESGMIAQGTGAFVGQDFHGNHQFATHNHLSERQWFSILPLGSSGEDHAAKFEYLRQSQGKEIDAKVHADDLLSCQLPVNPQVALLELRLEQLRKNNVDKERRAIPDDLCRGWWRIIDPGDLVNVERCLHMRGAREQILLQNIKRNMDFIHESCSGPMHISGTATPTTNASKKMLGEPLGLEPLDDTDDIEILPNGIPAPDVPGKWSREVALRVDKYILEQVEALEDKVASASMQVPGWKLPNRPDIETRKFRPSCCLPEDSDNDSDCADPIEEAKQRLLELEANIERRYLKAPLGHSNAEVSLQTITSSTTVSKPSSHASSACQTPVSRRTTNTSLNISKELSKELHNSFDGSLRNGDNDESNQGDDLDESKGDDNGDDDDDDKENSDAGGETNGGGTKEKSHLPRGLVTWREGVRKAQTAAQLAMGFYVLETSIAWHKSIMKAFCQLCHSGDDEDSLLLCDGCDKGYHMYCFKPAITTVPEGDWYCFECINKATGVRHCLVCGKPDGKHLVPCTSCPRAYHTECLSPALSKVPRGKWQCPGCNQKTPKKKIPKKLKILVGGDSPPEVDDITASRAQTNTANSDETTKDESNDSAANTDTVDTPETTKKRKESKKTKQHQQQSFSTKSSDKDLAPCHTLVAEMEACDDSWPFLFPVNAKQFPTYRKIIRRPMDIATIKRKLDSGSYKTREEFCDDVRLIFANCEVFNEDDSPVGKAGHAMRHLFDTRWVELIGQEAAASSSK